MYNSFASISRFIIVIIVLRHVTGVWNALLFVFNSILVVSNELKEVSTGTDKLYLFVSFIMFKSIKSGQTQFILATESIYTSVFTI